MAGAALLFGTLAALTSLGRAEMVTRIVEDRRPIAEVAAVFGATHLIAGAIRRSQHGAERAGIQPDAVARLDELKKLPGYHQGSFIEKAGWATFGNDKPNSAVARACANALSSAVSKSASAS